jgi:hypothetical protein
MLKTPVAEETSTVIGRHLQLRPLAIEKNPVKKQQHVEAS